jgi:hypothetical protein
MADIQLHGEIAAATGGLAAAPIAIADALVLAPAASAIVPLGRVGNIRRVTVSITDATAGPACGVFTVWTQTAAAVVVNRYFIGMGNRAVNALYKTKTVDIDMPIDATAGPITIGAAVTTTNAGATCTITLSVRVD